MMTDLSGYYFHNSYHQIFMIAAFNNQLTKFLYVLEYGAPGGPVVKNLPANGGDMRSIPGLGISHMPQAPSLCHDH